MPDTKDVPRIPEGNLASDRVRKPGDVDLDALTDDTGQPGNAYPQSYDSAANEAKAAQDEVDRLEGELEIAKAARDEAKATARDLKPKRTHESPPK